VVLVVVVVVVVVVVDVEAPATEAVRATQGLHRIQVRWVPCNVKD